MIDISTLIKLQKLFNQPGGYDNVEAYKLCKQVVDNSDNYDYGYCELYFYVGDLCSHAQITYKIAQDVPKDEIPSISKAFLEHINENTGAQLVYDWSDNWNDFTVKGEFDIFGIEAKMVGDKIWMSFNRGNWRELRAG